MKPRHSRKLHPQTGEDLSAAPSFVTDFLPLASYLICRGYTPVLQGTGSGTVLFFFEQSAELTGEVASFHNGTAQVEPLIYDSARVSLRKRMDAQRRGQS